MDLSMKVCIMWCLKRVCPRSCSLLLFALALMTWPGPAFADEENDPKEDIHKRLLQNEDRLSFIDAELERLEGEQRELISEVRAWHQERREVHERVLEDEDLQQLRADIQQKQRELHDLQAELSRRLSEDPDYRAAQDQQQASLDRNREIQRDIVRLSEERVQVQLAIQALTRALQPEQKQAVDDEAPTFNPALEVHPDL